MKKKLKLLAGIAVILILFLLAGFAFYVRDYYHADPSVERYMGSLDNVYTEEIPEGLFLDGPGEDRALVFYPGGKVEYRAYLPLCHKIAAKGIDCFLVEMPCNLAILDIDKADSVFGNYSYSEWIIGGHSLGGAAAALYAAGHREQVQGLILLGAYPTKQLGKDLKTAQRQCVSAGAYGIRGDSGRQPCRIWLLRPAGGRRSGPHQRGRAAGDHSRKNSGRVPPGGLNHSFTGIGSPAVITRDGNTDRLIDRSLDGSIDRSTDRSTGRSPDRYTGYTGSDERRKWP